MLKVLDQSFLCDGQGAIRQTGLVCLLILLLCWNKHLLAHLYKSTCVKSYCCHSDVGISIGMSVGITHFSYVMDKALSSELSCTPTGLVPFTNIS